MQNKWNGCWQDAGCAQGFVPVCGNWDLGMDTGCERNARRECCKANERERNCAGEVKYQSCAEPRVGDCCDIRNRPCDTDSCTGRSDCTCERCSRRRTDERCDKRRANNRGVGIVWAKKQELGDVYDCAHALRAGSLFPELHKPLSGYYPCDTACGDQCQQIAFVLWELRLYLNTHPCDQEALAIFRRLCREAGNMNYATAFLKEDGMDGWRWGRNPWPWEYEGNCCE